MMGSENIRVLLSPLGLLSSNAIISEITLLCGEGKNDNLLLARLSKSLHRNLPLLSSCLVGMKIHIWKSPISLLTVYVSITKLYGTG